MTQSTLEDCITLEPCLGIVQFFIHVNKQVHIIFLFINHKGIEEFLVMCENKSISY